MPRRKLTLEDRIKGARSLLRSTKKVPEHFKKAARALLAKHGYAVALAFALLLALPAHAQREQVRYASQFYNGGANSTVGAMYTAAQASCVADTNIPCIIVADSTLAVFPAGVIPTPCAQCLFLDYRSIGKIQYASAAQTTLTDFGIIGFPLLGPNFNGCTAGNVSFSFSGNTSTGLGSTGGQPFICVSGSRAMFFSSGNYVAVKSVMPVCWSSSSTDAGVSCDTGLSRGAANEVDCGNGAAADKTCTFRAAQSIYTGAPSNTVGAADHGYTTAQNQGTFSENGSGPIPYDYGLHGTITGALTAASTLAFFNLGETSALTATVYPADNRGEFVLANAHNFGKMVVSCRVGGVNASDGVVTARKIATDQTMTCTTGVTTSCSDTVHPFSAAGADTIGVKIVTQAASTLADCTVTLQ